MDAFWVTLATLNAVLVVAVTAVLVRGNRLLPRLHAVPLEERESWPRVSIVVAARNEQAGIEPAVRSLLAMDYDRYDVLVVDDRSTDATAAILDRIAADREQLRVVHLEQLPDGWLGKNHALWCGAQQADGEYILFTDADVIMEATTLRRAITFMQSEGLDHLAVTPDAEMPSPVLEAFVTLFINLFAIYTRPWKVSDPRSSAHCGIGAFNLVRRDVYQAVGTHQTIAMRPDDDVKLGKIIKAAGYRQRVAWGARMIRVPWYSSVGELIRGLEKNAFSGVNYRVSTVLGATAALLTFDVWPFVAGAILAGTARYLYLVTVATLVGHAWWTARTMRFSVMSVPLFPLAVLLLIYIQWRAMLLTYWRGGIQWRGTHYPLDALRANKV